MAWTNIAKPTTQGWTNINPSGRIEYDQADINYDDADVFYDSIDPNFWNMVTKPTNGNLITKGMATGLITPPTYSRQYDASGWTKVQKPLT